MRLLGLVAVTALGFSINAASPVRAKVGAAEMQKQGPYTQSNFFQMAGVPIGRTILAPGQPVLQIASQTCEEKTKRWKKWFPICLKECEDIAASYSFYNSKTDNSPATTSLYQKELNSCIDACNSKNNYYLNDLC